MRDDAGLGEIRRDGVKKGVSGLVGWVRMGGCGWVGGLVQVASWVGASRWGAGWWVWVGRSVGRGLGVARG